MNNRAARPGRPFDGLDARPRWRTAPSLTAALLLAGCAAAPTTTPPPGSAGADGSATVEPNFPDEATIAPAATDPGRAAWEAWKQRQGFAPIEELPEFDDEEPRDATGAARPPATSAEADSSDFHESPFGARPIDWAAARRDRVGTGTQPNFEERVVAAPVQPTTTPATTPTAPLPATPAPAATDTSVDRLDLLLVDLERELFRRSTYSDRPLREIVALASLALVDEDLALTDDHLRGFTEEDRARIRALWTFFRDLRTTLSAEGSASDEAIAEVVARLRDAVDRGPELELPAAALCWAVRGFAAYERFEKERFTPGQQVILYLEIAGFRSKENERGRWVTELQQQLRVYDDASGTVIWEEPWQTVTDESNKPRTDFYTTQKLALPERLPVGRFHFKIQVRDAHSGAEAEASIPFEIVVDSRMAAQPGK